ncbi:sigma factor-like helix-turn-helix DNA-binding protein [Streptomyces nigra]|uniref:sigma factor-like helix-turn-helix DNA-binding protein n=1 Tax=Streptomyces nigra TaxID=1827580 RepID=UPI0034528FD0
MAQRKSPAHFAKQAQEAYELSIAGYSQRQIAEKMGIALATVQKRLALYIENRTMPLADEYRKRQISRLEIYIRSLWSQINNGDPKAIAAAVRTEERIAKLMGTDSATLFKVEATHMSKESDALEAQKMLDQFFGRDSATPQVIPHVDVTQRRRRPTRERPTLTYATHTPADEFASEPDALEEVDIETADEFEPIKVDPSNFRKKRPTNPAEQFLVDNDD